MPRKPRKKAVPTFYAESIHKGASANRKPKPMRPAVRIPKPMRPAVRIPKARYEDESLVKPGAVRMPKTPVKPKPWMKKKRGKR